MGNRRRGAIGGGGSVHALSAAGRWRAGRDRPSISIRRQVPSLRPRNTSDSRPASAHLRFYPRCDRSASAFELQVGRPWTAFAHALDALQIAQSAQRHIRAARRAIRASALLGDGGRTLFTQTPGRGSLMKLRGGLYPFASDPLEDFRNLAVIARKTHEGDELSNAEFMICAQVCGSHFVLVR